MTKKETKLNATLRRHLLSIAKGFANDQKINNNHQYYEKISMAQRKYVEENITKEITKLEKEMNELNERYLLKREELVKCLDKVGLCRSGNSFCVNNETNEKLKKKIDHNADIQWDVILSTVALKLELCNTYEEAKTLIEQVTGANVDSMITTIIPPNLQLTNNNN